MVNRFVGAFSKASPSLLEADPFYPCEATSRVTGRKQQGWGWNTASPVSTVPSCPPIPR